MNRPLSFFVPWVCAAWLAGCAAPVPQAPPVRTAGIAAVAPGIELHHPRLGLVTSGQPAAADWAPLAAQGIRTVVNLRPVGEQPGRDEASEVRAAGMRYIDIPVANADAINPENARRLHQALSAAYRDGPVLLHCARRFRAEVSSAVVRKLIMMPFDMTPPCPEISEVSDITEESCRPGSINRS